MPVHKGFTTQGIADRLVWMICALFVFPAFFVFVPGNLANLRNWHLLLLACFGWAVVAKRVQLSELLQADVNERSWRLLAGCSFASFILCCLLQFYAFRVNGMDFSIFDWMLYNTNFRKFMTSPVCNNCNHFGVHPSYIMLPLVPLHRLFQSPLLLQSIHAIALWSAQFPLRRLAEKAGLPAFPTFLVVVSFLVNSWTGSILNHGFHFEVFFVPTGLFLIWSWLARRRGIFFASLILFFSIKEDAVLYASAFAVGAILTGDSRKKDALLVLLLGLVVAFINLRVAQPYFLSLTGDLQPTYVTRFWGKYGGNKHEIVLGMLHHPHWVLIDVLGAGWVTLLGSMLFLPLLSAHAVFAFLPFMFLNGTASSGDQQLRDFAFYYSSPFLPFAFWGLIASWRPLLLIASRLRPQWTMGGQKVFVAATVLFALNTGGYQKFPPPRMDVQQDIRAIKRDFEGGDRRFCVQLALFPHLPYHWNLNSLEAKCLVEPETFTILAPELDPNPFAREDILRLELLGTTVKSYQSGLKVVKGALEPPSN